MMAVRQHTQASSAQNVAEAAGTGARGTSCRSTVQSPIGRSSSSDVRGAASRPWAGFAVQSLASQVPPPRPAAGVVSVGVAGWTAAVAGTAAVVAAAAGVWQLISSSDCACRGEPAVDGTLWSISILLADPPDLSHSQ